MLEHLWAVSEGCTCTVHVSEHLRVVSEGSTCTCTCTVLVSEHLREVGEGRLYLTWVKCRTDQTAS